MSVFTGTSKPLLPYFKDSISKADKIIISFIMESSVRLILDYSENNPEINKAVFNAYPDRLHTN